MLLLFASTDEMSLVKPVKVMSPWNHIIIIIIIIEA